jgi:hypothetical protein
MRLVMWSLVKKIITLFPRFQTPGTKYYLTHDKSI